AFDLLHMLALELTGKIDEAAKEYTEIVNNSQMNLGILYRYFEFCIKYERQTELSKMADRLNASTVPEHKALAPFFRAEELLLREKKDEALSLLETAKTDQPDFAFRAAILFSKNGMLDQALSRYLALVDNYPEKQMVFANIAEVYLAKGMKTQALSYAKRCWETNPDDELGQFIYAQVLTANGQYQDAERVLKIPNRKVELPDEVGKLWSDIMLHCVQEDLAKGLFSRALERAKHYLIFFPEDSTFQEFKARAEQEFRKKPSNSERTKQESAGLYGGKPETL
ncbi:MAG: tetratricopeptide repeat protein, partial [Lentisphaeria bacterium]|nr:tetratricopeptide repeat protein [Lentisphaeria bacterium]